MRTTNPRPPLHLVSDADRALYRTPEVESALTSTRTEAQARAERLDRDMADLRAACIADGISESMADEIVRDTRNAISTGQAVRSMFEQIFGGR